MPFSKDGAGYWLGDLFDRELGGQLCASGCTCSHSTLAMLLVGTRMCTRRRSAQCMRCSIAITWSSAEERGVIERRDGSS
jgi:hypothetical protein